MLMHLKDWQLRSNTSVSNNDASSYAGSGSMRYGIYVDKASAPSFRQSLRQIDSVSTPNSGMPDDTNDFCCDSFVSSGSDESMADSDAVVEQS